MGDTRIIRRVGNGWIVTVPSTFTDNAKDTLVYGQISEMMADLPQILDEPVVKVVKADPVTVTAEQKKEKQDSLEKVERELERQPAPKCHRCKTATFVVGHPVHLGHWWCENCKLDMV